MKQRYQIYCDRGNGPELDGCWGSENAQYSTTRDAIQGAIDPHQTYPDCAWIVKDEKTGREIFRKG